MVDTDPRGVVPVIEVIVDSRNFVEMIADSSFATDSVTWPIAGFALIYGMMLIHLAVAGSRCTSLRRDVWCFCKIERNKGCG